jgi:DNA-directed RNA polymerase subunit beta'
LKDYGYKFATKAGISICVSDMVIPHRKDRSSTRPRAEINEVEDQYNDGLITEGEKYNKVVDIWTKRLRRGGQRNDATRFPPKRSLSRTATRNRAAQFQPHLYDGRIRARGSKDQMKQLAGMRGLMAKPTGEIIESPLRPTSARG